MSESKGDRPELLIAVLLIMVPMLLLSSGCSSQEGVKAGDKVRVTYTASFPDGGVFESNANGTPLEFVAGRGMMIQGFDEAVLGMVPGQSKRVTIPPDKAYGSLREDMISMVPAASAIASLKELADTDNIQKVEYPGMEPVYSWRRPDGSTGYLRFSNLTNTTWTVDENHPLAGKVLIFDITLVEIIKDGQGT